MNNIIHRKIITTINSAFDYKLSNIQYFESALTHKCTSENNYERLEILGDAVLQILITEILYHKFPSYTEGEITISRQNLVNSKNLEKIFKSFKLESIFNEINPNFIDGNVYADLFESIIGALYLDSNFERVKKIINNIFLPLLLDKKISQKDPKTILQEFCHSKKIHLPIYKSAQVNKSKSKYKISCEIQELNIKESMYANKVKPAEQKLALLIYNNINEKV